MITRKLERAKVNHAEAFFRAIKSPHVCNCSPRDMNQGTARHHPRQEPARTAIGPQALVPS